MKFKTLLFTLLLTVGFTFQNCCNCPDILGYFFDIKDMKIINQDSQGLFINNDQIPYDDFGFLTLLFEVDYIAYEEVERAGTTFSSMNAAYGCDCLANGGGGSRDEIIEDLVIITINDFDDNHLANDTITDLFTVTTRGGLGTIDLPDYILDNEDRVRETTLPLSLKSRPTLNQELQVRLRLELSTGERYDAISQAITFE